MVDFLESLGVNLLFTVGGDGTQRAAHAIATEAQLRRLPLAVVGIPKTIDNDLPYVWESFGYKTALEKAREVLDCAHAEAKGVPNGISLVKLMGRDSGSIAAGATLASQEVNFTLVPEIAFELEGEHGSLACLKRRVVARAHAVIVVAEGAGQELMPSGVTECDASGNVKPRDIGLFLRDRILQFFAAEGISTTVRYLDPSYIIRSVPRQYRRLPVMRPPRPQRYSCRDGGQDRRPNRHVVQHLHPRSDSPGDRREEASSP